MGVRVPPFAFMPSSPWAFELSIHHKLSDQIRPLVSPILDAFCLDHFSYFSVDEEGSSTCLCSSSAWMEHYFEHELYKSNPFLRHPELVIEGMHWSLRHGDPSLAVLQKRGSKVIGFSFGRAKQSYRLMNNLPLVEKACLWFESEAKWAIDQLAMVPLKPLIGRAFGQGDGKVDNLDLLMELVGVTDAGLSRREKQCLFEYIQGKSARLIGEVLGISQRTVESYLETVKGKLRALDRQELIEKGLELWKMGILP